MEKENKNLSERQELINTQDTFWTHHLFKAFPPLRSKNYRIFFTGQLISFIGTWMHIVALGWLVLEMTQSAFWVALVLALDGLPVLFLSLPAGVLADRLKRRRFLVRTQFASLAIVFIFGLLIQFNLINLPLILILTLLLGISLTFELPTRHALVFDVVGGKDISSAVALNVVMFNSARIIGPAISGIIVAAFNIQTAFFLNAVSFLFVIIMLRRMTLKKFVAKEMQDHPIAQLREGISFAKRSRVILTLLMVVGFTSVVPWTYGYLLPSLTKQVFMLGSIGYGILLSAAGIGALVAAIFVSVYGKKLRVAGVIPITSFICGCSIVALSFTSYFLLAAVYIFIIGVTLFVQIALTNATIQRESPDHIRGRILSIYTLMFLGLMPLGSIAIGIAAGSLGVQLALRIFGVLTVFGAFFYLFFLKPRLEVA